MKVCVYVGKWIVLFLNAVVGSVFFSKDQGRFCYLDGLKMEAISLVEHFVFTVIVKYHLSILMVC